MAEFHAGPRDHQASARQAAAGFHLGPASSTPTRSRPIETLQKLDPYKPLVTYDNHEEVIKIARYAPACRPGAAPARAEHRLDGRAIEQVRRAARRGGRSDRLRPQEQAGGRGAELSRRQPVHQFAELHPGAAPGRGDLRRGQVARLFELKLLDIGGGFPAHYDDTVPAFKELAKTINAETRPALPEGRSRSSPSRAVFWSRPPATSVAKIIGKAVRDGKLCYYIDDGVYHTFSGVIFDHCQYHHQELSRGARRRSAPSSARPATRSTRSRWPSSCPISTWATCVYQREHRRLQRHASSDVFQRLPAGEDRAYQPVTSRLARRRVLLNRKQRVPFRFAATPLNRKRARSLPVRLDAASERAGRFRLGATPRQTARSWRLRLRLSGPAPNRASRRLRLRHSERRAKPRELARSLAV